MLREVVNHGNSKKRIHWKKAHQNILGIISVVFASVSLIGSWVPLINVIFIIFGISAIIIGTLSLIFVLTKKATFLVLPLIGIILSIISITISISINIAVLNLPSNKNIPDTKIKNSYSTSTTNNNNEDKYYKVGDTISISNHKLTVTNVQRNYNPKYGKPTDGQEFIKVTVKFENSSEESVPINAFYFKIQDENGVIKGDNIYGYNMDDYLSVSEITPKEIKIGSLVFEVPKGNNNLTLIIAPLHFLNNKQK